MSIIIDPSRCVSCAACVQECVFSVLRMQNCVVFIVNESYCISCGHCEAVCPANAISIQRENWFRHHYYSPDAAPISTESFVRMVTERRSIRRFQKRIIEDQTISYLLETARYAPTGVNRQNLKYIVLKNSIDEILGLLAENLSSRFDTYTGLIDRNTLLRIINGAKEGRDSLLFEAPVVILILDCLGKEVDGAIAATHIMLLAQAIGLGSCLNGISRNLQPHPQM